MLTFDEEIRRVDKLLPSGELLYASSTAARWLSEPSMIFTLRYLPMKWVEILDNYLEIWEFFVQTKRLHTRVILPLHPESALGQIWYYIQSGDATSSSPLKRLFVMINNYWSQVPPKVVTYMDERVGQYMVPFRYCQYSAQPTFLLFKTYLAEIYYYFSNISLEEERPYLAKIFRDLQVILQTLHGYYLEALQALKELRKDLVDVRMLDFVMGTHDRLGEGSRVSLLGRDTLSIIRRMLDEIH